jgi:hypothetical protein
MDQNEKNTTGLYSDSRQAPYDLVRSERAQFLSKMAFPEAYLHNTQKEDLCLQLIENFRAQYVQLYPARAPLLLSPLNECMKQKFISTFIRPTQLPYVELYDFATCAKFVSNYVMYDPLEDPEALPQKVMSPTTVMLWQVGNCVEMSLLLCSMLIANGYNAFCVVGYAAREVVENDQTRNAWHEALPVEVNEDDAGQAAAEKETQFTQFLKKRPALQSTFDRAEAEAAQGDDAPAASAAAQGEEPAEARPKLFHAWVLVQPKQRRVEAPFFLEPATGMVVQPTDPRYHVIEAVFNHHNYFVNMTADQPIAETSFDLHDLENWEHAFLNDPELVDEDPSDDNAATASKSRAAQEESTADLGEAGDLVIDLPASWVGPLTLSRAQYENRYPGRGKEVRYSDAVAERFAEYSDAALRVLEARVPDDQSVHHDQTHTFYQHRQDLLRRRSVYPALERNAGPRRIHEWFDPGRKKDSKVEGLREIIDEPGVQRTMRFYWKAREDGLVSRTELVFSDKDPQPRKIVESYRARDEDRLFYRSATYDAQKESGTSMGMPSHVVTSNQREESRNPYKMAEKFERNAAVPAAENVSKRTFIKPLSPDGEIWVRYHYSADCITQSSRLFPKGAEKEKEGAAEAALQPRVTVMPFQGRPKEGRLRDELRLLIAAEKECLNEIKAKMDECKEIVEQRRKDVDEVNRSLSVYDTLRNRPRETEAERELQRAEEHRRAESRKDYLAPYIANLEIAKSCRGDYTNLSLSAENAKFVRDSALKDLKERLIQRGHIMQARMDREKEELNRRQVAYQKNLDSSENLKESEDFAKFLQQATWRMKILDDRLTRHIEQASEKYAQLAQKLADDGRLVKIYDTK